MTEKVVIRNFSQMQELAGDCGPSKVEFVFGEFAIDVLGHATAADMLAGLDGVVRPEVAKTLVDILLDNELLFDSTIESELGDD